MYIIDETVTRLRYDANHQVAVTFLDRISRSEETGILRCIYIDEMVFQEAISLFRHYDSALLSLTDCVSFTICKRHEIHEAFAFDRHFSMMGISLCST